MANFSQQFVTIDSASFAQQRQGQPLISMLPNNVQTRPAAVTRNEEGHVLTTGQIQRHDDHLEEESVQGEESDDGNKDTKFDKELFIEEIRGLRCLWDVKFQYYKDRNMKLNSWRHLACVFNKDGRPFNNCCFRPITFSCYNRQPFYSHFHSERVIGEYLLNTVRIHKI